MIDTYGDFRADSTDGYIRATFVCSCCGSHVSEDDLFHTDNGVPYCPDCYHEHYCYCEYEDITVAVDEAIYISNDNLPRLVAAHGEGCYSNDWLQRHILRYL